MTSEATAELTGPLVRNEFDLITRLKTVGFLDQCRLICHDPLDATTELLSPAPARSVGVLDGERNALPLHCVQRHLREPALVGGRLHVRRQQVATGKVLVEAPVGFHRFRRPSFDTGSGVDWYIGEGHLHVKDALLTVILDSKGGEPRKGARNIDLVTVSKRACAISSSARMSAATCRSTRAWALATKMLNA